MNRYLQTALSLMLAFSILAQPAAAAAFPIVQTTSRGNRQIVTDRFQQEALGPAARWTHLLLPAFSAIGLHLIFTHTSFPDWLGLHHAGNTLMAAAVFFPGIGKDGDSAHPWLIGHGRYEERRHSPADVHLLTARDEAIQLLDILLPKVDGPLKARLQMDRNRLDRLPASPGELTQTISELRKLHFAQSLEDPAKRKRWSQTHAAIEVKLAQIQVNWGVDFRNQLQRMILELESALPLTGDKLNSFQRYVEEPEHGLLHSLVVIDEAMHLASSTFEGRPNFGELMSNARVVLSGIGLYHDLTGLRDRVNHHETAAALARHVLSQVRTADGSPQYAPEEINQIALGCLRHRGDAGFPQAESELEKIFKDVDEYILVADIARIIRQGIKKGAFQHRKWDIYRRYVIDGGRSFNQHNPMDEGESDRKLIEFYQENPSADYFTYLFYTQMRRTNPDAYDTPAAKAYVSEAYYRIKPFVAEEMERLIREDVLSRAGFPWEINNSLMRMNGITTEMEAIYRGDSAAQETLRREMGSTDDLADRMIDWVTQSRPDREHPWLPGATYEARKILSHMDRTVLGNSDFNRGLDLFAGFLENPDIDLDSPLGLSNGTPPNDFLFAGFADGIYRVVRDRVQDLFKMVRTLPDEEIPDAIDIEMAQALAQWFLFEVNQGKNPQDTLDEIRGILDSFRYGTKLPGTWDAPARTDIGLLLWIRRQTKGETHGHTSAMPGRERVSRFYAETPRLVTPFQNKYGKHIDPTDPHQLKQFGYGAAAINSPEMFESAFGPGKIILSNDPDLQLTREWYAAIIEEAAKEGNRIIAITSTFDAQIGNPYALRAAVIAALDGYKRGEDRTQAKSTGLLMLGLRKSYTPAQSRDYFRQWMNIRKRLPGEDRWRLFGIDNVGWERDEFDLKGQLPVYAEARAEGQWSKMHIGEMWKMGNYGLALAGAELAAKSGIFYELVNLIALFVHINRLNPLMYSTSQKMELKARLKELVSVLRTAPDSKEIHNILNLSPTSNEANSRDNRRTEGWDVIPLSKRIQQGIVATITGDDHGIFDTTTTQEHYNVYVGASIYGALNFHQFAGLLKNSGSLAKRIIERVNREKIGTPLLGLTLTAGVSLLDHALSNSSLPLKEASFLGPSLLALLALSAIVTGLRHAYRGLAALKHSSSVDFKGTRFPFTIEEIPVFQAVQGPDKKSIQRLFDPHHPMSLEDQGLSDQRMSYWLAHQDVTRIWVARDTRRQIQGYAWADFKVDESRAEIQGVDVAETAQKNGIGTALFDVAVEALSSDPKIRFIDTYDASPLLDESDPEKGRTTAKIVTELVKPEHRFYSMDLDNWYRWERSRLHLAPKHQASATLRAA